MKVTYYYGVQTALAYMFNHYFYGCTHYTYVAAEYYPYRRKNPRSSSPHRIYEDLFEPWREKDEFSKVIDRTRVNIKNGILAHVARGTINLALSRRLSRICDEIDVRVFYPMVYRVNIRTIDSKRLTRGGSGNLGSFEYLISDLKEHEIDDILFLDYQRDAIIRGLVKYEYAFFRQHGSVRTPSGQALSLLEARLI